MTWNEIYEKAIDAGCGDDELKAKDEARFEVRELVLELGAPDLDKEECPEDWVESYCDAMEIRFSKYGNIVSLKFPDWIEEIVYRRKEDEYLSEDLRRAAEDMYGEDVEIGDEQMAKMITIYRHDADCNIPINSTLDSVVSRAVLRRKTRDFIMDVTGESEKSIKEFLEMFCASTFGSVRNVVIDSCIGCSTVKATGAFSYTYSVEGECPDSLESVFFEKGKGKTLVEEATRLSLRIEMFSNAQYECDKEHFLIKEGKVLADVQNACDAQLVEDVAVRPLYVGDSVSVFHNKKHEIQSYEKILHTWELYNSGEIEWTGRKLVYMRKPKDRPEATPSVISIPDVEPGESIKISTLIDGRGFDGITECVWEMQDKSGQNCFPESESLFSVTVDAKYKRG